MSRSINGSNSYLPTSLLLTNKRYYKPLQWKLAALIIQAEQTAYSGCSFKINNWTVLFRVAKITPTKIGFFVTLWKRFSNSAPIQPYDQADDIDFFIIHTATNDQEGQFIFSKNILLQKGVLSINKKGGKRGIRVYPPWEQPTSAIAKKTQQWQLPYFILWKERINRLNEYAQKYQFPYVTA